MATINGQVVETDAEREKRLLKEQRARVGSAKWNKTQLRNLDPWTVSRLMQEQGTMTPLVNPPPAVAPTLTRGLEGVTVPSAASVLQESGMITPPMVNSLATPAPITPASAPATVTPPAAPAVTVPPAYNPNAGTGVFVNGVNRTRGDTDAGRGIITKPTANDAVFKDISGLNVTVGSTPFRTIDAGSGIMRQTGGDVAFGRGQGGVAAAPTQSIMSGTWKPPVPTAKTSVTPTTAQPATTTSTAQPAVMSASDPIQREISRLQAELVNPQADTTGRIGVGGSRNGRVTSPREREQQRLNDIAIKQRRVAELQAMLPEAIKADQTAAMEQQKLELETRKQESVESKNKTEAEQKQLETAINYFGSVMKSQSDAKAAAQARVNEAKKYDRERIDKLKDLEEANKRNDRETATKLAKEITDKMLEQHNKEKPAIIVDANGVPSRTDGKPLSSDDAMTLGYNATTGWSDPKVLQSIAENTKQYNERSAEFNRIYQDMLRRINQGISPAQVTATASKYKNPNLSTR